MVKIEVAYCVTVHYDNLQKKKKKNQEQNVVHVIRLFIFYLSPISEELCSNQ